MQRDVFIISDGTGITAETMGHGLLTQFQDVDFNWHAMRHINTEEKAGEVLAEIERIGQEAGTKPIVIMTVVDHDIYQLIADRVDALVLDLFHPFIRPLEKELGLDASKEVGATHGLGDYHNYTQRIEAVNYALANDDGANIRNYQQADIILIGVSRSGKTPTSLYLAMQFGMFTANYPFTEDDMTNLQLPDFLRAHRERLFGLTIDPFRLHLIRQERRAGSEYASIAQCEKEVKMLANLYNRNQIPYLDTTARSIEEIATEILSVTGKERRLS